MEIPQRKLNRLSEYDYGQEGAYFVTLCIQNRSQLFQMELPVGNGLCAIPILRCRVEHVFDEDAISGGRIVNKDMSYSADQLAVLDNGTVGHFCVK